MKEKKTVAILFGGKYVEHKVSLISAKNIYDNIDSEKYNILLIGIAQDGSWYYLEEFSFNISDGHPIAVKLQQEKDVFFKIEDNVSLGNIDVIFPVLHGNDGEDGSIQGLLTSIALPYVGTGVLGSSVSFDKVCSKKLLTEAGIKNAKYLSFPVEDKEIIKYSNVVEKLGLPLFIKPVASGSSVGVSKAIDEDSFYRALDETFLYDNNVLIEEFINGREIECAILGNLNPDSSLPGEITVTGRHDFYSFDAKYIDDSGSKLDMPAKLNDESTEKVRKLAIEAYRALYCEDFARVDMFVKENGEIYLNEINTIPGFTNISMFPQLWKLHGVSYTALISKLIESALLKYKRQVRIKRDFDSEL